MIFFIILFAVFFFVRWFVLREQLKMRAKRNVNIICIKYDWTGTIQVNALCLVYRLKLQFFAWQQTWSNISDVQIHQLHCKWTKVNVVWQYSTEKWPIQHYGVAICSAHWTGSSSTSFIYNRKNVSSASHWKYMEHLCMILCIKFKLICVFKRINIVWNKRVQEQLKSIFCALEWINEDWRKITPLTAIPINNWPYIVGGWMRFLLFTV